MTRNIDDSADFIGALPYPGAGALESRYTFRLRRRLLPVVRNPVSRDAPHRYGSRPFHNRHRTDPADQHHHVDAVGAVLEYRRRPFLSVRSETKRRCPRLITTAVRRGKVRQRTDNQRRCADARYRKSAARALKLRRSMMLYRLEKLIVASIAASDREIGRIKDVYFDDHRWTARYQRPRYWQ